MMICGVLMFRERIDLRRLRKTVERALPALPALPAASRCRQPGDVVLGDRRRASTSTITSCTSRCPGRGGKRELQTLVSRLASTPLDPARPLWQFHLVDNYDGGSALVARIHHCYADGIALVQVMLSMTDAAPNGPPALPPPPQARRRAPARTTSRRCSRSRSPA